MKEIDPIQLLGGWFIRIFEAFSWRDALDVSLVVIVITYILRVVRETRAIQMLRALAIILVASYVARRLSFNTTNWLLSNLALLWAIGLVIVMQPELRRLVAGIGEQRLLAGLFPKSSLMFREIAKAANLMARNKFGGLVILERETSLMGFAESGVRIDAGVNAELITSIFTPRSPLHDGAVIIRGSRVYAAACMLPLSAVKSDIQGLGMRHRAALGITEETDALAIVVSEDHQNISLALRGQMTPPLSMETLERMLAENMSGGGA